MDSLAGKTIWIIGASTGIGRSLALELAAQGASLALSARSQDKLTALNEELGDKHHIFPLDVSDVKAFEKTAERVHKTFKHLDSVIFLAALYNPASLADMDIQAAHMLINVNVNGALNTVHSCLPLFHKQKCGQLVLCGSVAGYRGLPNGQPYCASKAAVISLAESLRSEEAPNNIDVKVINPGFVRTPLTDKNDFNMPMMIESEEAAMAIAKGLTSRAFEIHFPKKFTILMKLIALMPHWIFFKLMKAGR